uniref:Ca2+-dependent phosphoinositide-specific phospholipase C n=1 Tax=uncultured Caulobacter sp. TaxID=158749 RepID=UPI0025EE9216|nr:Ca2+-dependent phosphoinositide-specific phospholipase C [uncultured Caulobacter sp.]
MKTQALALLAALALTAPAAAQDKIDALKLNQIQVVGTHNSYHLPADPRVLAYAAPQVTAAIEAVLARLTPEQRKAYESEFTNGGTPDIRRSLDYVEPPLSIQLAAGVRSLELDLHHDPEGGRFADPMAYRVLREKGERDLAPFFAEGMDKPGLKVLHMSDIDVRSQCPTFRLCLKDLRQWSDANPGHTPVFMIIEPKAGALPLPGAVKVLPFDAAAWDEYDRSILEVIGRDKLITPDDVRGAHATLEEAVLAGGWPTVAKARGKFIFLVLSPAGQQQYLGAYLVGHPSLKGRTSFIDAKPGDAHAAFMQEDNALADTKMVTGLVKKGYIVRSRSDIDTEEARRNDTGRRDTTLAAGPQVVSTDYYQAPNLFGNDYHVAPFKGGARCNPVSGGNC